MSDLSEEGGFLPVDRSLAETINHLARAPHDWVSLAVSLASKSMREGNICVDLLALASSEGTAKAHGLNAWPQMDQWRGILEASGVVGDGSSPKPLVLEEGRRLYLYRYWLAERHVAADILARSQRLPPSPPPPQIVDWLTAHFGPHRGGIDWQRVAAATALLGNLSIIVGGPGTGKTSTVVRLLAVLQRTALDSDGRSLRVELLAPTGKAAARLVESIQAAKQALSLSPELAAAIPGNASTVHRALYRGRRIDVLGRYEAGDSLLADIVVVDEASMVDLALLSSLLDAMPASARLILLGDDEQLASVEAGSVLGDLTAAARGRGFSPQRAALLEQWGCGSVPHQVGGSPLRDQIVELHHSYRFDRNSGIGALVAALRDGDTARIFDILDGEEYADIEFFELAEDESLDSRFDSTVIAGYQPLLDAQSAEAALGAFEGFRILAVHRRGALGVEGLTRRVEQALGERGLEVSGRDYARRPVLVTENSYRLSLYNGDIGMLWPGQDGAIRAHFSGADSGLRVLAVPRLPACETAFVMSVHKSQGSEFDAVACVLPNANSPLLTREMLYTAVSRARKRVALFATRAAIAAAAGRRVARSSGLARLVWRQSGQE